MHKAEVTAEFITPCFCSGADQGKAELRVRSIRGMLRWWCRACYPKTKDSDLETELFGSTQGASPVKIRVQEISRPASSRLPEKRERDDRLYRLLGYLWYFLKDRIRQRAFLPEGTQFKIILSSEDQGKLTKALKLCVLWILIGSLGARGTRAAGAMKILHVSPSGDQDAEIDKIVKTINVNEYSFMSILGSLNIKSNSFSIYHAENQYDNGLDASQWLAEKWFALRNYKETHELNVGKEDHDDVVDKLNHNRDGKIRRAVLGMPYHQRIPRSVKPNIKKETLFWKFKITNKGGQKEKAQKIDRLTSPVHLRPICDKGHIYPAVIIFKEIIREIVPEKLQVRYKIEINKKYSTKTIDIAVDKEGAIQNLLKLLAE